MPAGLEPVVGGAAGRGEEVLGPGVSRKRGRWHLEPGDEGGDVPHLRVADLDGRLGATRESGEVRARAGPDEVDPRAVVRCGRGVRVRGAPGVRPPCTAAPLPVRRSGRPGKKGPGRRRRWLQSPVRVQDQRPVLAAAAARVEASPRLKTSPSHGLTLKMAGREARFYVRISTGPRLLVQQTHNADGAIRPVPESISRRTLRWQRQTFRRLNTSAHALALEQGVEGLGEHEAVILVLLGGVEAQASGRGPPAGRWSSVWLCWCACGTRVKHT